MLLSFVDLRHHIDYIVCHDKVKKALEWLIAHHSEYSDLQQPDCAALNALPENDTVYERLTVLREGAQAQVAENQTGPHEAAGDTDDTDEDGITCVAGVANLGNRT